MRFLHAFRVAFWSALHAETARRVHELTITINVDSVAAEQAIDALEVKVAALSAKAEYAALMIGRLH